MTTFTKTANTIFRTSVAAALALSVPVLVKGQTLFNTICSSIEQTEYIEKIGADVTKLNFSGIIGSMSLLCVALIIAAILSCVAFKCSGKACSIFRSLTLFGMAGLTTCCLVVFSLAESFAKVTNGTATAEQIEIVNELEGAASVNSLSSNVTSLTISGAIVTAFITAILVVLMITSVMSLVKTFKTEKAA